MGFLSGFVSSWDKYDLVWLCAFILFAIASRNMRKDGAGELRDFLHENGIKLIVVGLAMSLVVFAHHSSAMQGEGKFADWCMAKAGEALACFFGLISGAKLIAGNGNGNSTATRTETATTTQEPPKV